ncbi:Uncharacterised protein [Legionella cherrii]|uniref:Protein kinase domain-containing protein n=2 Tax=Legionella cherrii TaxID=28084 RepID=A0ABY6T7D7_9GAMM|nr:Uncharacterised protein [Legionella cherrii]
MKRSYRKVKRRILNFLSPNSSTINPVEVLPADEIYGKLTTREQMSFSILQSDVSVSADVETQLEQNNEIQSEQTKGNESDSDSDDLDEFLLHAVTLEDHALHQKFSMLHSALDNLEKAIDQITPKQFNSEQYAHINELMKQITISHYEQIQGNFHYRNWFLAIRDKYQQAHFSLLKHLYTASPEIEISTNNPQALVDKLQHKIVPMMEICSNLSQSMTYDAKSFDQLLSLLHLVMLLVGGKDKRAKISSNVAVLSAITRINDKELQIRLHKTILDILKNILKICVSAHLKEGTIKENYIIVNGQKKNVDILRETIITLSDLLSILSQTTSTEMTATKLTSLLSSNMDLLEKLSHVENYVSTSQDIKANYYFLECIYDDIEDFQKQTSVQFDRDPYLVQVVLNVLWSKYETICTRNFIHDLQSTPVTNNPVLFSATGNLRKLKLSDKYKSERLEVAVLSLNAEDLKRWIASEKSANESFYQKIDAARIMIANRIRNINEMVNKLNNPNPAKPNFLLAVIQVLEDLKLFPQEELIKLRGLSFQHVLYQLNVMLEEKQNEAKKIEEFLAIPLLNRGSYIQLEVGARPISIPTEEIRNLAYLAGGEFGIVYSAKYLGNNSEICALFPSRMIVFKELRIKTPKSLYEFEQERDICLTLSDLSKKNPGLNCPSSAKGLIVNNTQHTEIIMSEYVIGQQKRMLDNQFEQKSIDGSKIAIILRNKSRIEQFLILASISMGVINAELLMIDKAEVLHLDAALRNILLQINEDGSYTVRPTDFGLSRFLGKPLENGRKFTKEPESAAKFPLPSISMQRFFGHGGLVEESAGLYELKILLLGFVSSLLNIDMRMYIRKDQIASSSTNDLLSYRELLTYYNSKYQKRFDFDAIDQENISRYFDNVSFLLSTQVFEKQQGLPYIQDVLKDLYIVLEPFIVSRYYSLTDQLEKFKRVLDTIVQHSLLIVFSEYQENQNLDELMACIAHIRAMLVIFSQNKFLELTNKWNHVFEKLNLLQNEYQHLSIHSIDFDKNLQALEQEVNRFIASLNESTVEDKVVTSKESNHFESAESNQKYSNVKFFKTSTADKKQSPAENKLSQEAGKSAETFQHKLFKHGQMMEKRSESKHNMKQQPSL